jgi:hypothetical protein
MRVLFFALLAGSVFPSSVFAVDPLAACSVDEKTELKVSLLYDIRDSLKEELSNCAGINKIYRERLKVFSGMLTVERERARLLREEVEANGKELEESLEQNIEHESELGSLRRRLAGQLKFLRAVSVAGGTAILLLFL